MISSILPVSVQVFFNEKLSRVQCENEIMEDRMNDGVCDRLLEELFFVFVSFKKNNY